MLKHDLKEAWERQKDLEDKLDSQENLIRDIYEEKLRELEGRMQEKLDIKFKELQTFILGAMGLDNLAPLTPSLITQL